MLVNVPQGLVTFDWADGGDIWQDVHPHDNEEVLMEQCKRVKALGTGATTWIATPGSSSIRVSGLKGVNDETHKSLSHWQW